ncbi:hypothetical protein CEXT_28221 [Caerostris extrusa]|uniref:Uncharacterized protein n=1 Tax=Caerostris extrusa TaxID=172846 RepID=A0AAV4TWD2_CAEEX|nr:hypothetical protein CEXT_28221 [Caerostris extrusa]
MAQQVRKHSESQRRKKFSRARIIKKKKKKRREIICRSLRVPDAKRDRYRGVRDEIKTIEEPERSRPAVDPPRSDGRGLKSGRLFLFASSGAGAWREQVGKNRLAVRN